MTQTLRLVLVAAVALALADAASAQEPARLVVSGEGEAAAAPDIARFVSGVTIEGDAAAEIAAEANARMRAVMTALREAGVAEADLRTLSVDLSPVYAHDRGAAPRLTGWRASQRLSATLRSVDALGPAIDAAIAAGATDVQSVAFDVSDRAALRDEARRAAVADARAAAALLADAAGVALGPLVSLSLDGNFSPAPMMRAAFEEAQSTPIAAGSLSVRATVSAVYEVE